MTLLPQQLTYPQMLTKWASILNPLLSKPSTSILKNVVLSIGNNSINHKLGRELQGWKITRLRGTFAEIYDNQDDNSIPELTLILNSNTIVTIDLEVF